MGRNALINDVQIAEFTCKYIPKELNWKPVKAQENHFEKTYKLGPKDYPLHTSFFREASPQLPLWPLLADFLGV